MPTTIHSRCRLRTGKAIKIVFDNINRQPLAVRMPLARFGG
jgi:hypothetical protein